MPIIHYLNVGDGDCSIIQHGSGRVTVIDVSKARRSTEAQKLSEAIAKANYNQKVYPDNPIEYMRDRGINSVFRFILTHPDMDHMDGLADLFAEFSPPNFWDTKNNCDKSSDDWDYSPYRKEDWDFYESLRSGSSSITRLCYHSGQQPLDFWHDDGLSVLAPTTQLVADANDKQDWNDSSYVLLYQGPNGRKAVFPGDSHDASWEHILATHASSIGKIDLLVAPHHGRHSDRDFGFLDVLQPKLTLFGNASSEHLAYDAWSSRSLPIITNNQGGSLVIDFENEHGLVYCTNEKFARDRIGDKTFYEPAHKAWFCDALGKNA